MKTKPKPKLSFFNHAFWMGVARIFDFSASLNSSILEQIRDKTVADALDEDSDKIAGDFNKVYAQEKKAFR